jgi:hypothetical protein
MAHTQTITETPLQRVVNNYEARICGKWKPTSHVLQSRKN